MKPSQFAAAGSPHCSLWGKSEIEWIAHDYVRALTADGDIWKPLTAERVAELVTDRPTFPYDITSDHYRHWFDAVAAQLSDAEGAKEVWRVSLPTLARLAGLR